MATTRAPGSASRRRWAGASLAVAGSYVALNFAYTAWLRRVAIADIAAIAGAFVIRAAAGGVAAGVTISPWFFVVVSFAALLVAAGKRYADFLDPASRSARATLAEYNADFLRMVITAALAVAVGGLLPVGLPGRPAGRGGVARDHDPAVHAGPAALPAAGLHRGAGARPRRSCSATASCS